MKNCENRILKEATLKLDIYSLTARVAELADALDSKSSSRKGVGVRFPPLVLNKNKGSSQDASNPYFLKRRRSVHGFKQTL